MRLNDRTCLNVVALSMILIFLQTARCDLPIHCLKHQIPGKWVIQTTQGYKDSSKYVRCGHSSPDNQESFANRVQLNLKVQNKINIELLENGDVETILEGDALTGFRQTGNWTMMYDEGIIIKLGGTDYFGFFKYSQLSSSQDQLNTTIKYEYDCTQLSTGWYSSSQRSVKGCMTAIKLDGKEEDRHLKSIDKNLEVQPNENEVNNFNEVSQKEGEDQENEDSLMADQRQSQFSSLKKAKVRDTQIKTRSQMLLDKALDKILSQKTAENRVSHDVKVDYLNGLEKKWIAGISESFKNLSREEVNKKAGRTRRKKSHRQQVKNQTDSQDMGVQDIDKYLHYSMQDVSDLPKDFTWIEYIETPLSQNDCGSCYVIATISMLNARLKIKMGKEFLERISMQHILNCSFYSQGCEGGYPYEVGRFGSEYFLIQEKLAPLTGATEKCQNMKKENLEGYFKITNYGFVGGAYGRCNEREMMLEIMNNGPIVANLKIDDMFLYYSSGVFHSVEAADWIIINEKEPEWRPVEHAVLCYGWGESEEEGKYWLMQNSWGSDWGTEGRFKIRRGTDESFVESSAEFANVEFFKNS